MATQITFSRFIDFGTGGAASHIHKNGKKIGHIYKVKRWGGLSWIADSYQVHWEGNMGPSEEFKVSDYRNARHALLAAKGWVEWKKG